jgi:serine/threonine protein kinase
MYSPFLPIHHGNQKAPEILRPEPYTHSVDWWSLGILFYALLQGKVNIFKTPNVHLKKKEKSIHPPARYLRRDFVCAISLTFS